MQGPAPPLTIDSDGGDGASAATAAAPSSPVAYFRDALPPSLLGALRRDAEGLACCSNFWVPRSVLSGEEPAMAAFEQAAAALARRCLSGGRRAKAKAAAEDSPPPLHPLLSVWRRESGDREEGEDREEEEEEGGEEEEGRAEELLASVSGAECWCQLYEGGRGLDPHYDKDEEASAKGQRPLRHPRVSTVVYLNGNERESSDEKGKNLSSSLGATVVINQRLHPRSGAPLPAVPTSSALLWPRRGAAAAFDGRLAHCVLSSSSDGPASAGDEKGDASGGGSGGGSGSGPPSSSSNFDERKRATVLFNFWCGAAPGGVLRVTEEDILAAGLSRPVAGEAKESNDDDDGGDDDDGPAPTPVPPAAVAVPRRTTLCLLDDLLRPQKALDHPYVVVSHPGYELVEAEVREDGGGEGAAGEGEEELEGGEAAAAAKSRPAQVVFIPLSHSDDSGSGSDSGSDGSA